VLESEIRQTVAKGAARRTFVHAGVVGWNGRAILVPGRSRSGKTTLVAELVKAGAQYLSDEFAVLDGRGRVHPFAKPLSIRGPAAATSTRPGGGLGALRATTLPVMAVLAEHRPERSGGLSASPGTAARDARSHRPRLRPSAHSPQRAVADRVPKASAERRESRSSW
jgi:hypothetical protein